MSSREIATLTGKQHKEVIRDTRVMLISLYGEEFLQKNVPTHYRNRHSEYIRENADSIMESLFGDGVKRLHQPQRGFTWSRDTRGYISEFSLDKEHAYTLTSGYNVKLRHRVVARWLELEGALVQAIAIPQTLPEALRLAADQAEQNQKLLTVIQEQAPKVRALAVLTETQGSICITDAAKHIGMPPKSLFSWLKDHRWIYRRTSHSNWSAFQPRLSSGLLEHKLVIINRDDATDDVKVVEHVLVTRKGLTSLAEQITGASL
jgi:phage antirepressor YoqD-like protein